MLPNKPSVILNLASDAVRDFLSTSKANPPLLTPSKICVVKPSEFA